MKTFALACLVIISLTTALFAAPLLEVDIPDRESYKALMSGGFDIVVIGDYRAEIIAWPGDLERLSSSGLVYRIIHEDIGAYYASRFEGELDDMNGYPTFDEIGEWVLDFVDDYPDIVSGPDTIGYALEERPIWLIKISDNPGEDEDEPELFLNSAIHAREVITPLVLMNFAELLCEGYGNDDRITGIVNNREIWILPVVNPDGYTFNEYPDSSNNRMWRKNKRRIDDEIFGVDLNRNFDFMWGNDDEGSSPYPWSQTYRGESPASEPETQVVQDFCNSRQFVSCINYHSYSNLILYPFSFDTGIYPEYFDIYVQFAELLSESLGWATGRPPDLLYSTNGDATDWMEGGAENSIFAFTFEVGSHVDGFWPPQNRVEPLVEEQEEPLLVFCEIGGEPFLLGSPPVPLVTVMDSIDGGIFAQTDTASGEYSVTWTTVDEIIGGIPVAYDVRELSGPTYQDGGDGAEIPWESGGFYRTDDYNVSPPYCYHSDSASSLFSTLTADHTYRVEPEDTLRFMTRYSIEQNYDYAYVQVSVNGEPYINLEGNITSDFNPNGSNWGNGITGEEDEWIEARFPLNEYAGQSIRLRFAYRTDTFVNNEGFFIDDISPVLGFDQTLLIAEAVLDTFLTIDKSEIEDSLELYYEVRSIDEQEQVSGWSVPQGVVVIPEQYQDTDPEHIAMLPDRFHVKRIYPNPFNPQANIRIELPGKANVNLTVFDLLGREVERLHSGPMRAGTHQLQLDGNNWASGIYLVRIEARGNQWQEVAVRKAVLIK